MKYNFIVCSVKFTQVTGKCYLAYSKNLNQPVDEWAAAGPSRFYSMKLIMHKKKRLTNHPIMLLALVNPVKEKVI